LEVIEVQGRGIMNTDNEGKLSPELLALRGEYREMREQRDAEREQRTEGPGRTEPENAGREPADFVALSEKVADNYTPSGYLQSAPIRR
jgi:hypothetical protein